MSIDKDKYQFDRFMDELGMYLSLSFIDVWLEWFQTCHFLS